MTREYGKKEQNFYSWIPLSQIFGSWQGRANNEASCGLYVAPLTGEHRSHKIGGLRQWIQSWCRSHFPGSWTNYCRSHRDTLGVISFYLPLAFGRIPLAERGGHFLQDVQRHLRVDVRIWMHWIRSRVQWFWHFFYKFNMLHVFLVWPWNPKTSL